MSTKLRRGRISLRRTLRIESLERRTMMHSDALDFESPPTVEVTESVVTAASSRNALTLDADGDGRIDLSEMRSWLTRWRQRLVVGDSNPAPSSADAPPRGEEPAPPTAPDVLPAVPTFGGAYDWHLNAIGAPEAWSAGYTGQGVTIAVIDTGVDFRSQEFRNQLWRNPGELAGNGIDDDGNGFVDDVHGWDFVNDDATPQDRNGHGTHVASLVVGARDGVGSTGAAYGSDLMVLQGLGANGVGDTRDVARAVRYAVDEGADIINVSLSGGRSTSLESAIRYANENGVLVVAAAGNENADAPNAPASLSGHLDGVISVGAYDQSQRVASFSNGAGQATQITAPGVRLRAAVPGGYGFYSGTSMAAPLVSGVAALALSAAPHLSADQLRRLLVEGAAERIAGDDSHGAVNAAVTVAQAAKTSAEKSSPVGSLPVSTSRSSLNAFAAGVSSRREPGLALSLAPLEASAPLRVFNGANRTNGQRPGQVIATAVPSKLLDQERPEGLRETNRPQLRLWEDGDAVPQEPLLHLEPEAVDASLANWAA